MEIFFSHKKQQMLGPSWISFHSRSWPLEWIENWVSETKKIRIFAGVVRALTHCWWKMSKRNLPTAVDGERSTCKREIIKKSFFCKVLTPFSIVSWLLIKNAHMGQRRKCPRQSLFDFADDRCFIMSLFGRYRRVTGSNRPLFVTLMEQLGESFSP